MIMNLHLFKGGYAKAVIALLLSLVCHGSLADTTGEKITVGVYFNPPLSFIDQDGTPSGFVIEILNHIAVQEHWDLDYVDCTWEECNELLVLGEIDMLSPIAASDAQQRQIDYNRESLFVNWGQIVTNGSTRIESPLDLRGKTVIAITGDVYFADLKELAAHFDIDVRFLEVDEYEDVLAWVAEGPADAGLINRSFEMSRFPQYPLKKSSVIFNPAEIRIALSPRNSQLENARCIQRLDANLSRLKGNRNSYYYQAQQHWFGEHEDDQIPLWVWVVLLLIASISLFLSIGIVVLRRQIAIQTQRFREISERFSAFMNNLPGMACMKDADGRYLFVNSRWEQGRRLRRAEVLGKTPAEIWPDKENQHESAERKILASLSAVESDELSPWDENSRYWRVIKFPILDSEGKATMVGGIGWDITAQKDAEAQYTRLNRQLQLLLESVGEGIFGLDGLGKAIFINQVALDLLGYNREEIIDRNIHDLIQHSRADGSAYPETESPIYLAIRQGERSRIVDQVFWRADGTSFEVEYTVHPIADGEYPGAVVVFRNKSDH